MLKLNYPAPTFKQAMKQFDKTADKIRISKLPDTEIIRRSAMSISIPITTKTQRRASLSDLIEKHER